MDLGADESVDGARDRLDRQGGSRADRRSEGQGRLEAVDETFGGVRDGRRMVGVVSSRLDASRGGVEDFERMEGDFGCGWVAGRPYLGGVGGACGGLAVLGTDEDRSSWEVAVVGLGEVAPGWLAAVEADVLRAMRIMEQLMVRTMARYQMDGAVSVHLASLHTPKRGDGQKQILLVGSSRQYRVVWVWARGSLSA